MVKYMIALSDRGEKLMGDGRDDGPKKMSDRDITITKETKINIGTIIAVGVALVALFGWLHTTNNQTQVSIADVKSELVKIRYEIEAIKIDNAEAVSLNVLRLWARDLEKVLHKAKIDIDVPDPYRCTSGPNE